jgi:hypothetical protein
VITLALVLALVMTPAVVVYVIAYRRMRVALDRGAGLAGDVPTATVAHAGPRWTAGRTAQRVARRLPAIQAGLVAFAMASIAFMMAAIALMTALALTS